MKVIANRFKVIFPKLISQEQAGFIAGWNISNNIILAQEVIHSMRCKQMGRNWMAIKLDLEKAYDRVSWDYINDALTAVGIPIFLRRVIMSAITSSSMQILWNGVPTRKFKLVRGIHQGCPLSPYLFVLCMKGLGHSIRANRDASKWKSIWLSRSGPELLHLFFAGDLVIFCKAQLEQARLLESILKLFCANSGHRISVRKSNIYFSKSTEGGVPLLHERVTSSMLGFIVEKVRRKLQNWDARKLSIVGRITLAKSVLLSIPNYFMQSLMILKGVCFDIEKFVRQFIWGSTEGPTKMSLVKWDSICQPRARGGLGFRHLSDQNTSFLMKIEFSLASKSNALWVLVLRSKYGWEDHLPDSISKNHCSHL
ncbi:LINE-1 reverse transcriptase isogeny [Gossypium australe]|uniref:LINE-1 reverse transcriptase isogeny n=1 Tax=Gossypium australe TaxID=47621 RepID=A0A5B6VFI8_9ROSI|nr:LINE-1 reverse transcriptase isogeny [Gossypium australe]